jgi:hypothetical protein
MTTSGNGQFDCLLFSFVENSTHRKPRETTYFAVDFWQTIFYFTTHPFDSCEDQPARI